MEQRPTINAEKRTAPVALSSSDSTTGFSLARLIGHEAYDTDPLRKTADTLKTYSGWVFAAVSTISTDVRSSDWAIFEKSGPVREDWKRLDDSRIPPVLVRPNASQTWGDLIELTQVHMDLAGKAFWSLITAPGSSNVVGIQVLNPDWVTGYTLDESKTRQVAWRVEIPGAPRRNIPAEDVMFFRYPDPVNPFDGMSPVRAVALSYDMDTYARAYGASHLRNHAQPTGILTTESDLTREQAASLAEAWKDTHLGQDSIQVLGKGANYQPLSAMLRDLEFLSLARVSRDQILAAYHVPASRLGLIEDSSRANGEESDRVYASLCLGPRLRRYEEPITLRLLPRLGFDPSRFSFEFDSVDVADKEFDRIASGEAFTKGAITLNEYRSSIGLGPERNGRGDVYYMPIGAIVTDEPETGMAPFSTLPPRTPTGEEQPEPEQQPARAAVGEAAIGESVDADLVLNGAQVTSLIQIVTAVLDGSLPYASALEIIQSAFGMSLEKAQRILGPESNAGSNKPEPATPAAPTDERAIRERILDTVAEKRRGPSSEMIQIATLRFLQGQEANERRMKAGIRKLFAKEAKLMVAAATNGTLHIEQDGVEIRAAGDNVLKKTAKEWFDFTEGEVTKALRDGFELLASDTGGVGISYALVDEQAVGYAAARAGQLVTLVTEKTKSAVANVVREGIQEGWSTKRIADELRTTYDGFKGARAQTIARTETGNAMNAGKHMHAKAVEDEYPELKIEKTWTPVYGDDRTREWHRPNAIRAENNGSTSIPVDQDFIIHGKQMARPHDERGGADNVINCRCVLTYDADQLED
jgi:HK97 family phage portal protein